MLHYLYTTLKFTLWYVDNKVPTGTLKVDIDFKNTVFMFEAIINQEPSWLVAKKKLFEIVGKTPLAPPHTELGNFIF